VSRKTPSAATESFTAGQVARLCRCSHNTVVRWIERGALAGYRLPSGRGGGRERRVTRRALAEFLRTMPGLCDAMTADELAMLGIAATTEATPNDDHEKEPTTCPSRTSPATPSAS
jgi:excisionase family DNA binding protein